MTIIEYFQQNSLVYHWTVFFMGLIFGSFFNVVIFRFPMILKKQWLQFSKDYLEEQGLTVRGEPKNPLLSNQSKLSLSHPGSHCPKCDHKIKAWENIPILSYLFLRGKCSNCQSHISLRYPVVELLTGLAFLWVSLHFSFGWTALFWILFTSLLIILCGIDIDHQLLPDPLVYILLWTGILASLAGLTIPLSTAITGALVGYLSLWFIFWLFKLISGKEGMGYGDFKLLAALGVWIGWKFLLPLIIVASILGALIGGISMLVFKSSNKIPFGPYLATAGWIMVFWGQQLVDAYLRWAHIY